MKSKKSRLRKITLSLTPQQAAINYVAQLQRFESLAECCASFLSRWENVPPLEELSAQVKAAVESAKPDAGNKETQAAVREVVFLTFLRHHVVGLVAHEEDLLVVLALLVEERVGRMIGSLALGTLRKSDDELILKTRSELFVEAAVSLATRFHILSAAVKFIEDKYFAGTTLLFNSSKLLLGEVDGQLDRAVGLYNDIVPRCSWGASPIDLAQLSDDAREQAEKRSADLITMAQSDTMTYMGDHAAAHGITRRLAERAAARTGV
jgi:hypothetical protein